MKKLNEVSVHKIIGTTVGNIHLVVPSARFDKHGMQVIDMTAVEEELLELTTNNRQYRTIDSWLKTMAANTEHLSVSDITDALIDGNIIRRVFAVRNDRVRRKAKLGFEPHPKLVENANEVAERVFVVKSEVGPYTTSATNSVYALRYTEEALKLFSELALEALVPYISKYKIAKEA